MGAHRYQYQRRMGELSQAVPRHGIVAESEPLAMKAVIYRQASMGFVACLIVASGCTTGRAFREAALPSLEAGIALVLDGLVDGVFAAIEPEPQTETTTTP